MASPTILVVRNEPDSDAEFHCDALADCVPGAREVDATADDVDPRSLALDDVGGVVLTGSTAGVYEVDDRPWIADVLDLVPELVERELPTLGVCFGHQVVTEALGGRVEASDESTAGLVDVDFADDPLFEGVTPVVPALHGDRVVEPGDDLRVIAAADYYEAYATRHVDAPLWTVQFHPELTTAHRDRLVEDHDWTDGGHDFDAVDAHRVVENFRSIVAARQGLERA